MRAGYKGTWVYFWSLVANSAMFFFIRIVGQIFTIYIYVFVLDYDAWKVPLLQKYGRLVIVNLMSAD